MTIVFLIQDTGSMYGAERATLDLVLGLQSRGIEVAVVFIQENRLSEAPGPLVNVFKSAGIAIRSRPVQGRLSWNVINDIRDVMSSYHLPILHTIGYKADIHGCLASHGGRLFPVVSTVHGWLFRPKPKELFYQWLNIAALKRYTRVIALSRWYEQYLVNKGISRVVHIPAGIDPDAIASTSEASKLYADESVPFTFGMLGRLSWEKNQSLFLRAISTLPQSNMVAKARFLIAGEGPDRPRLEEEIVRLRLSQSVEMKGFMNSSDFFRQVHVLVQCSRMENLSYSMMESMVWMRPVIASDAGGSSDLIQDGVSGCLIKKGDVASLSDKLLLYINQKDLYEVHGRMGRQHLVKFFARQKSIDRHIELYAKIL